MSKKYTTIELREKVKMWEDDRPNMPTALHEIYEFLKWVDYDHGIELAKDDYQSLVTEELHDARSYAKRKKETSRRQEKG